MDVFSTWELASATWLLALIGLCFYFKAVREAALEVIKVIFRGRLRQWALLMVAYVILVCFALKQIGLWELSDFKLSLLWLTTAAFLMTYRTANEHGPVSAWSEREVAERWCKLFRGKAASNVSAYWMAWTRIII